MPDHEMPDRPSCQRILCPDALNGRPHWHTRPADDTTAGERECCRTVRGETHRDCPETGHNEHGVAMCACKPYGRVHSFEPGESCSPSRVIPPATSDADDTPQRQFRDPSTGEVGPTHDPACAALAHDDEDSCSCGAMDADDTPPPAAGDVEALAKVHVLGRSYPLGEEAARAVLASDWLKAHDAARDAAPYPGPCSQCGERESAMVKVGTTDGWCTACLDEAAEVETPAEVAERIAQAIEALGERKRGPYYAATADAARIARERAAR